MHAEVDDREYVIIASARFPKDVGLSLSSGGRAILSHDWWGKHPIRRPFGDRIRSVSDAKNVAEEWEAAEAWKHHMDVGDSDDKAGWRLKQVEWQVLPSEPGTVSFECITEDEAYRLDCVPQDIWNQILGEMRQAVGHGEDFEPVMQAWLRRIEADCEGDEDPKRAH
ncbi:MAG: hypothetical protein ACM4D3_16870 [Candidatus Sericytochromatia bacterium]